MEKYGRYAKDIPEEVRLVVASLHNSIRQAILVLLSRNVELSFSDIQKELGLDKVKLNFHLKNLFSSALVDHYYRHEVGNQKYSYYSITPIGRRMLTYLIQALIPPSPIQKIQAPQSCFQKYGPPDDSFSDIGKSIDLDEEITEYMLTMADSDTKINSVYSSQTLNIYTKKEE